mmetsp:Transcript_12298/g.36758  ORF Transcript_12298/g.36758 Transcript_12298/m.36758 type:complete len:223 (+) Transcript_12298:583-1251(+)
MNGCDAHMVTTWGGAIGGGCSLFGFVARRLSSGSRCRSRKAVWSSVIRPSGMICSVTPCTWPMPENDEHVISTFRFEHDSSKPRSNSRQCSLARSLSPAVTTSRSKSFRTTSVGPACAKCASAEVSSSWVSRREYVTCLKIPAASCCSCLRCASLLSSEKSSSSVEDRSRLVDSDDEYVLSRRSSAARMGAAFWMTCAAASATWWKKPSLVVTFTQTTASKF